MTEENAQAKGELRIDGDKLKAAARLQGMTLATVAEAMGMHYNGILRIVSTGSTNLGTLEQLCNVLNCSPLDLLVWDGYPSPKLDAPADLLSRVGLAPALVGEAV